MYLVHFNKVTLEQKIFLGMNIIFYTQNYLLKDFTKTEVIEETMSRCHALFPSCIVVPSCSIKDKCKFLLNAINNLTNLVDNQIYFKRKRR